MTFFGGSAKRLMGSAKENGLAALDAHLRRDTAAPKMGHPILSLAMEAARMGTP
jgi:hypothetical protein